MPQPAFATMEARVAEALPNTSDWQFEPKWDGFRCLAYKDGDRVELQAKSGKLLTRFFPDIADGVRAASVKSFVLDGELTIPIGDALSFDALQMRLHPAASRVAKLAKEQPAMLITFDCLRDGQRDLVAKPLAVRREALEKIHPRLPPSIFRLSPYTLDRAIATAWLKRAGDALDGVIAKPLGPYLQGERAMLKVKHYRSADCVVGGFRYEAGGDQIGSMLLGLYDDEGLLHHVGFCSGIKASERAALTKRLEKLRKPPGFTGDAPGGSSRWSTERSTEWEPLAPKLIAEVQYDHVSGGRFRHGTKFLRWWPDKAARDCTMDQLDAPVRLSVLMRKLKT